MGLGGLKHKKLKETFLKTVYKTKDFQQVEINPDRARCLS